MKILKSITYYYEAISHHGHVISLNHNIVLLNFSLTPNLLLNLFRVFVKIVCSVSLSEFMRHIVIFLIFHKEFCFSNITYNIGAGYVSNIFLAIFSIPFILATPKKTLIAKKSTFEVFSDL